MQIDEKIRAQFENLDELDDKKPIFVVRYHHNELVISYFENQNVKFGKIIMWVITIYHVLISCQMLADGYPITFVILIIVSVFFPIFIFPRQCRQELI